MKTEIRIQVLPKMVLDGLQGWSLTSKDWDSGLEVGDSLPLRWIAHYSGPRPGLTAVSLGAGQCEAVTVTEEGPGQWAGQVELAAGDTAVTDWSLQLGLSGPAARLESAMADVAGSGADWVLSSKAWDNEIPAGGSLTLRFLVDYTTPSPPAVVR